MSNDRMQMSENSHRARRSLAEAFTLIELLVVIAVIAILASLLLPTLIRAKRAGQSARCKSNLRQQGMALKMHVDESQTYPMAFAPGPVPEFYRADLEGPWRWNLWYIQLDVQLRGRGTQTPDTIADRNYIFRCPSFQLPVNPHYQYRSETRFYWVGPSYLYNEVGVGNSETAKNHVELGLRGYLRNPSVITEGQLFPTPESHVMVPSDMIAIGDGHIALFDHYSLSYQRLWGKPDQDLTPEEIRRSHNGTLNLLFCDGHVEGPRLQKVFMDRSDAALRRWNKDHEPHREWVP